MKSEERGKVSMAPAMVQMLDAGFKSSMLPYDYRCPAAIYQAITGQSEQRRSTAANVAEQRKHGGIILSVAGFVAWADAHGRTLVPSALELDSGGATGGEHLVFYDEASQRVVKLTKPGFVGYYAEDAGAYLERWALANRVFGDDVKVEGVVWLPDEDAARVVISQPFIQGRDATADEVSSFLNEHGFVEDRGRWIHPILGVTVGDTLTEGNAITRDDGSMMPIDWLLEQTNAHDLREIRERTGQGRRSSF